MMEIAMTNRAVLGKALDHYRPAMRGFVREKLTAVYGDEWWERGVLGALRDNQRETLQRDIQNRAGADRAEALDVSHLRWIITSRDCCNWDHIFQPVFGDHRRTSSLLERVALARNEWAHQNQLAAEQVADYLFAMRQVLETAGLPEAQAIEQLRRDVQNMGPERALTARRTARAAAAPAPAGALPYWWQVCEPHDAFKNPAEIDPHLFAATLGRVYMRGARDEYQKPELFFAQTYFTASLTQTIRDVASRLAGGPAPAVTEMQTPFGGGKTHALLALYHLVNDPATSLAVPGVREALGDLTIPKTARVVVFDGQDIGTEPLEKDDGSVVQTLWGELTYQVSPALFHNLIASCDARGEAPGNRRFRQVLESAAPSLILIDELVSYLVKLKFANAQRLRNQYRQTVQFLQELLQEAGSVPGLCVLISLPKSRQEFGGLDPAELQAELGVLDELQPRADRVVAKRTPVDDQDIYTLVSKRLFKRVDGAVARRVADAYRELYERERDRYDPGIFAPEYFDQQVAAYPLHPELVDVLYKKWSTASDFPRTRAVLQLLASIVADQWGERRDAYTIQSAHVNLERERIRTRIVSAAGSGFDAVVATDIIGGEAQADLLDEQRGGDYQHFSITRGVATTLLMHSFGGPTHIGALPWELRLGTVAPNLGPQYVDEVLKTLAESLAYVHSDGDRLCFQTRVNVYRVIARRSEQQPAAAVAQRLHAIIREMTGRPEGFRVLECAPIDGALPDSPELTIALLDPRLAVTEDEDAPAAQRPKLTGRQTVDQLWERHGGGFREWRNALLLVAPDRGQWAVAERAMREVMAYESVIDRPQESQLQLGHAELRELASRVKAKRDSLRTSVTSAYRWVFIPAESGLQVLPLDAQATRDERIAERVVARLSDPNYGQPKILPRMSAAYFISVIAPRLWTDDKRPLEIAELARNFLRWTYLPMLPRKREALWACISEGIAEGWWGLAIGNSAQLAFQRFVDRTDELDPLFDPFDGSASLVRRVLLEQLREKLQPMSSPPDVKYSEVGPDRPGVTSGASMVTPPAIAPPKRYARVRLRLPSLPVAKTGNLQPYLFRVLQEQDAVAELTLTIEVTSAPGISIEALEQRIVEGFDQLGISVHWEPM